MGLSIESIIAIPCCLTILAQTTGTALTEIGQVTERLGVRLVDARGDEVEVRGFDHFDGVDQ